MPHTAASSLEWTLHPTLISAVSGRYTLDRHRTGIYIHTTDTVEKANTDVALKRPRCVTLGVLLEGEMEFTQQQHCHHLKLADTDSCLLFAIVTEDAETLVRHTRHQRRLRKLQLTVEPHWIEQQTGYEPASGHTLGHTLEQALSTLMAGGSQCITWPGNDALKTLAEKILYPPPAPPALQQLQAEYHAVELLQQAFTQREAQAHIPCTLLRACQYIERHLNEQPSLENIATHAGLSISSLQRQFKQHNGQTVMHYIRDQKLQHARHALRHHNITIGEAAYHAGYKHMSNFVTAYKRMFGVTPGNEH